MGRQVKFPKGLSTLILGQMEHKGPSVCVPLPRDNGNSHGIQERLLPTKSETNEQPIEHAGLPGNGPLVEI
jgi:hypothetical protein